MQLNLIMPISQSTASTQYTQPIYSIRTIWILFLLLIFHFGVFSLALSLGQRLIYLFGPKMWQFKVIIFCVVFHFSYEVNASFFFASFQNILI